MTRINPVIAHIVEIMESPAHLQGCGPDCLCQELRQLPAIREEFTRRLRLATGANQ